VLQDFFHVVIQVERLDPVIDAYSKYFGYRTIDEGSLSSELAIHWGAPAQAGEAFVLMQPESGSPSYLRFIEGQAAPPPGTLGWNGMEVHVQNLAAVQESIAAGPFTVFSPAQQLSLSPAVKFMQVIGPGGELLFLNEMRDPSFDVGVAASAVDRPFVVACGALNARETLAWFSEMFEMQVPDPISVVMPALNRVFGYPEGTEHELSMVKMAGPCILEFDQYPSIATGKETNSRRLPPGYAIVSCSVNSLDRISERSGIAPTIIDIAPYNGCAAVLMTTPAGALIELVERKSGL
jgi:hypothetical protein